jgi:hypothetical protein
LTKQGTSKGNPKFDVFVSADGGPLTPFLQGTTQPSASFTGAFGHRYGFASGATDNLGVRQAPPADAQATTLVADVTPPSWPSSSRLEASNVQATSLTLTWTAADEDDRIAGYLLLRDSVLVTQGFWQSPEHRGRQVDQFYATLLHRQADPGGRASWVNALQTGLSEADLMRSFLTSAEYTNSA